MKNISRNIALLTALFMSMACNKLIDQYPQSNISSETFYKSAADYNAALTGCYNGLQQPMLTEWMLTDLRTDISKQGVPASTSAANIELNELDMYTVNPPHQQVYNYWLATYNNIRNANILLQKLAVVYNPTDGKTEMQTATLPLSNAERKRIAGEALMIRAYHYFNLVRLFGGVFLIHEPIVADKAKTINRSAASAIYSLIEADLKLAIDSMSQATYAQQTADNRGRLTAWTGRSLLAKVYLTQNKKTEASALLQSVIQSSGYSLQSSFANVFSIANEANSELLFVIRYKAGGFNLGNPFGNLFAPLGSGSAVINGDGSGLNYPTNDLAAQYSNADLRKAITILTRGSGSSLRYYTGKFLNPVTLVRDGEGDWPVLRYADVLLMQAEALGFSPAGIALINQVRARAGLAPHTTATITTSDQYEQALAQERRLELAFENHRFFDLVRYGSTMSSITAISAAKQHFAAEYATHYANYAPPVPTLAELQNYVTANKLLLPIPQREIDTNTQLQIEQNPGY